MIKSKFFWVMILSFLCFAFGTGVAAEKDLPIVGEYPLTAITHHTPETTKDSDEYWDGMQKIKLSFDGLDKYRNLPRLTMKQPYIGEIVLGPTQQKFAIIIDVTPDEKRLYIDSNGDGDFLGEPMLLLLNEWYGLQLYMVFGPEPTEVKVRMGDDETLAPIQLSILGGILNKPGVFVSESPYLLLKVKTWFFGQILCESGREMAVAIVDANNNGKYDDAEDCVFFDFNHNLRFEDEEARLCGDIMNGDDKDLSLKMMWQKLPQSLKVGEAK